jgi:hypothetical protein
MAQLFSPTKMENDELGGKYSTQGGEEKIQCFNKKSEDGKSPKRPTHVRKDNTERLLEKECVTLWTDFDLARISSSGYLL